MAKTNLNREQTIIKCEDYMLRGYDRPTELAQLLDIAYNTAREYIEVVKARWELQGDPIKRESARAELVKKAEEIIKEAWLLKSNAKNTMEKVSALRTILHAIERLTKLHGLDVNRENTPVVMSFAFQREREIQKLAQEYHQLPEKNKKEADKLIEAEIKKRKMKTKDVE
jgi:hypothetical protein